MRAVLVLLLVPLLAVSLVCGRTRAHGPSAHHNAHHRDPADPSSLVHLRDLASKAGIFVGTASNAQHIRSDKQYDEVLGEQFSLTTPENACKWGPIRPTEGEFNFGDCDLVVSTAEMNNQTIRGHNLCWGVYNPGWLNKYANNGSYLSELLDIHVTTVVAHYERRMYSWDVVNEAVSDAPKTGNYLKKNIWYPAVPDYIDRAFKAAHAADSTVKLFYNDYNCEVINAKSDAIYEMCKTMLAQGVPLHGMGIQAHFAISNQETAEPVVEDGKVFSSVPSNWSSVEANIKRFIDLGLEVHITELDVKINSESKDLLQQQADVYRSMLAACLKYAPKCRSFETWGFIDKYSWLAHYAPDYFDGNFQPKPCFYAVADELNKTVS